jgi:hypothetical protein
MVASEPAKRAVRFQCPNFGYVAQWVSELGADETLQGLLNHADCLMKPTWEKGELYYPRNDEIEDKAGNCTHVGPFTGNAAIACSRLDVADE